MSLFMSYEAYLEDQEDRWPVTEAEVNRERYAAELLDLQREAEMEQWEWARESEAYWAAKEFDPELWAVAAAREAAWAPLDEEDIPF